MFVEYGIHGGLDLSPLTEQNDNRRSILGYKQRCVPAWLATTAAAAEMGGLLSFAEVRVAP
jgi:hypothetical protein